MYLTGEEILATKFTPSVSSNPEGLITIKGRSMNGNMNEFSRQSEIWFDNYLNNPSEVTCIDFRLEYLDGLNLKNYISLIKKIDTLKSKDKKYIINWYYEEGDEDILEKGEYLSSVLNIPFNFIEVYDSVMSE
jgi:hypothetical protein